MADLPPLPPGYSLTPLPADPAAAQPQAQAPADAPALPQGYYADRSQVPAPPTPKTVYSGSILPFSTDENGRNSFDPNAGILGSLTRAVTAPGDVYAGKIPVFGADGHINPDLNDRAAEMATFGPQSTAMRAGARIPSAQQLKTAGGRGYDAARNSGLDISGDAVGQMARDLQSSLQADNGIIPALAPKTHAILDQLGSPPNGGYIGVAGIDAARRGLSSISLDGGSEGLAARRAMGGIDNFLTSLGPDAVASGTLGAAANGAAGLPSPQAVAQTLRDARGNYAAAQRSNDITGTLDRANTGILDRAEARAHASNSGANLDNSIRQRVASFLQNPENLAGFSQPEIDALNKVVKGGLVQNTARRVGNIVGGGGGLGQLAAGLGGSLLGEHLVGGLEGPALGAMLPTAIGVSAKGLENALSRRLLNKADETTRSNSPLAQYMQTQGIMTTAPMTRAGVIMRSLLPGLLGPPPQQQQPTGGLLGQFM